MSHMTRPFVLYILCFLHLFLGLTASGGGGLLILKPDGSLIGMETGWLTGSPFDNYLIPGFFLFTVIGLPSLFVAIGLLFKPDWQGAASLNIYPAQHWSLTYSFFTGIIVIAWIAIQILMTRCFWLQPVILLIGLTILILASLPSIQKHFKL
jgi:hypothetical protein